MEFIPRRHDRKRKRVDAALAALELPEAVFRTCPWQPRELVETGLRQWLRCCALALADRRTIGMPSHAVDEAWHGFILCTALYSAFCDHAYGRFLHHHPVGAAPHDARGASDPMCVQLGRTVLAWSLVADPDERCALWDLDIRVGVEHPWGVDLTEVAAIEAAVSDLRIARDGSGRRAGSHSPA